MPTPPVSEDIAAARRAAIDQVILEGFAIAPGRGAQRSAVPEAARRLRCNPKTLQSWWLADQKGRSPPTVAPPPPGAHSPPPPIQKATVRVKAGRAPAAGVSRFLLTAAQDDTPVHHGFWSNLLAYGAHLCAEVMVGGFTYQKGLYQDHASRTAVFAEAVRLYLRHENVELGPDVVFCAVMNTLPTAVRPLSGLQTYTRGRWGIFPHAKIQLESVPSLKGHPAMQMTTGVCTVRNYVPKKAGLVAEFHHCLGATLVEIDAAGRVFCRQLNAADDGSFQDLDLIVANGRVSGGHAVEGITWGDVHLAQIDPEVARTCWGYDAETGLCSPGPSILDTLRPRHQFWHDLLDFRWRNHHRRGDPHFAYAVHQAGEEDVEHEVDATGRFLVETSRPWCQSVVVPSNHHDALPRWLREADGRADPPNAVFWLRSNLAIYEAIARGDLDFDVYAWAARRHAPLDHIHFLGRNEPFVLCEDFGGGIHCGAHGHLGPNGARGSASNLVKVASKMNVGHAHTASILDGVYTAGLCGQMRMDYNNGPSGWSHTQIVTYSNGKRTLVTLQDGRWRA